MYVCTNKHWCVCACVTISGTLFNFYFDLTDDEEENEEAGGGSRFLGFMFGNVDNTGDLDADYLDEVVLSFSFLLLDNELIYYDYRFLSVKSGFHGNAPRSCYH